MLDAYEIEELEEDDRISRLKHITSHPFSIMIEADHLELDSLNEWLMNISLDGQSNWMYYGKFGYDFGIAEYFFKTEDHLKLVSDAVPRIFTTYPNAYPVNKISKSNGYGQCVDYTIEDSSAIVIQPKNLDR